MQRKIRAIDESYGFLRMFSARLNTKKELKLTWIPHLVFNDRAIVDKNWVVRRGLKQCGIHEYLFRQRSITLTPACVVPQKISLAHFVAAIVPLRTFSGVPFRHSIYQQTYGGIVAPSSGPGVKLNRDAVVVSEVFWYASCCVG